MGIGTVPAALLGLTSGQALATARATVPLHLAQARHSTLARRPAASSTPWP